VRLERDAYHLSWNPARHDHTDSLSIVYDVFAAGAPGIENYDFSTPVTSMAGVTSAVIDASGWDSARRYFFVVLARAHQGNSDRNTVEQSDRSLRLSGDPNFRDFGGYATSDGRRVGWGRLYRSAHLANLTPEDVARVTALGLRRVLDLRPEVEKQGRTDAIYPGNEDKYDLLPCILADPYILEAQPTDQLGADPRRIDWSALHINMLEPNKGSIKSAFDRFADASQYPILLHCSQGKDRAGILAALVLLLLGVPRDTIIEDYMLTGQLVDPGTWQDEIRRYMESRADSLPEGVTLDDWKPAMCCVPERMVTMFEHLHSSYGGVAGFLESTGVGTAQQQRIRQILLEG